MNTFKKSSFKTTGIVETTNWGHWHHFTVEANIVEIDPKGLRVTLFHLAGAVRQARKMFGTSVEARGYDAATKTATLAYYVSSGD